MLPRQALRIVSLLFLLLTSNYLAAYTFVDGDGFTYYGDDGYAYLSTISYPGFNDPLNQNFYPILEGSYMSNCCSTTYEDNGREFVSLPGERSGIELTKKIFVPDNGNFARHLMIMKNVGGSALTGIDFMARTYLRTSGYTITDSSNGDTNYTVDDRWIVVDQGSSRIFLALVWDGMGAAEAATSLTRSSSRFDRYWSNMSFAVGETKILMMFTVPQTTAGNAATAAQALDAMTNAQMLDGLSGAEFAQIVNWSFPDTDGDGMVDAWESAFGLNVGLNDSTVDSDSDGLSNLTEFQLGTEPDNTDTDGDGITDGDEVNVYGTNPTVTDSDGDGIDDGVELSLGTDPAINESLVDLDRLAVYSGVATGDDPDLADIAVDSNGNSHVVWVGRDTGEWELFYAMLDANGNVLIDRTRITDDDNDKSTRPSIAVDNLNRVFVVWHDQRLGNSEVYMTRLEPYRDDLNGSAANILVLKTLTDTLVSTDDGSESQHARLDLDSNHNVHIVWYSYDAGLINYAKFSDSGAELVADTVLDNLNAWRAEPDIVVDSQDRVHIVWTGDPSQSPWNKSEVYYTLLNNNGSVLIAKTRLTSQSDGYRSRLATISLTSTGNINLVWQNVLESDDGIVKLVFAQYNPDADDLSGDAASPSSITVIDEVVLSTGVERPRHPYARTDMNDFVHLTFQDGQNQPGDPTDMRYLLVSPTGGSLRRGLLTTSANDNAFWWKLGKVDKHAQRIAYSETNGSAADVLLTNVVDTSSDSLLNTITSTTDTGTLQTFLNIQITDLPAAAQATLPTTNFPYGLYVMYIDNLTPGATVAVTMTLPGNLQPGGTYYKWDPTNGWYTIPMASDDGDNEIVIYLTDGGLGDADGIANGSITDPGGPSGVVTALTPTATGDTTTVTTDENSIFGCSLHNTNSKSGEWPDLFLPVTILMWYLAIAWRRKNII